MNNAIRTVLAVLATVVSLAMAVGQCATDAAGATICKASWLSPQMSGYLVAGLTFAALIMKAFRAGGPLAGLFGETAVVSTSGKVGTVNPVDVAK